MHLVAYASGCSQYNYLTKHNPLVEIIIIIIIINSYKPTRIIILSIGCHHFCITSLQFDLLENRERESYNT